MSLTLTETITSIATFLLTSLEGEEQRQVYSSGPFIRGAR